MGDGRIGTYLSHRAFVVAGLLCLLVSIGVYESQVTIMFFDKSIDVTVFVIGTFLSSLLAPVVAWLLGPRRALATTSLALAAGTLVAVLVRSAQVELVASAVGCVAGMWWLAVVASTDADGADATRSEPVLPGGVPLALALLFLYRAAARTMPLDEMPLWLALPIALVLASALVWRGVVAAAPASGWRTTGMRGSAALFALPFVLALVADTAFNGAVVAGAAGLALGTTGPSTFVGLLAAGCGVGAALVALRVAPPRRVLVIAAVLIGAVALWSRMGPLPLAGGALLAFGLVTAAAVLADAPWREARVPVLSTIALGVGWVVSIVATLTFYISVGSLVPLAVMVVVVAAAVAATAGDATGKLHARVAWPLAAAVVLAPLLALATSAAPTPKARASSLAVMGYNIHLGYDDGDVAAIDAIASVVAAQSPDLVGLTEVTRGTVIAGGHDVLLLLAERLGMSYAFAPMLGDVEGVGILSRVPIDEVRIVPLARSTTAADLRRVALMVRTGDVWIVATHLGGSDIPTQAASIIAATRDLAHVVVTGDLNSTPESPQMRLFAEAGFTDLGARTGALTFSPNRLETRIDYIWVRGLTGGDVRTVQTAASDHLPVLANVSAR